MCYNMQYGDIMFVNGINLDDEEFVGNEKRFLKKHNNIYISDEQADILKKYNIIVDKYNNVSDLIYDIEEYINDSYEQLEDLEWVSETLSEYNYYNNTNK